MQACDGQGSESIPSANDAGTPPADEANLDSQRIPLSLLTEADVRRPLPLLSPAKTNGHPPFISLSIPD